MGKYNLKLEVDLVNLFASTTNSQSLKRAASSTLQNANFRREVGRRFIDEIVNRTQSGINKNGRQFTKYSSSYKESLVFEIYGKTSEVTLTLTGEMLASMGVTATPPRKVVIGFQSNEQEAKAHGHIFGGGYKRSLPVRDFFGLPQKRQTEILKEAMRDFNAPTTVFDLPLTEPEGGATDQGPLFDFG